MGEPGTVVAFSTKSGNTVWQNGKLYTIKKNGMWREIKNDNKR